MVLPQISRATWQTHPCCIGILCLFSNLMLQQTQSLPNRQYCYNNLVIPIPIPENNSLVTWSSKFRNGTMRERNSPWHGCQWECWPSKISDNALVQWNWLNWSSPSLLPCNNQTGHPPTWQTSHWHHGWHQSPCCSPATCMDVPLLVTLIDKRQPPYVRTWLRPRSPF